MAVEGKIDVVLAPGIYLVAERYSSPDPSSDVVSSRVWVLILVMIFVPFKAKHLIILLR